MATRKFLHVGCGSKSQTETTPAFADDSQWRELRFDIDPEFGPDIIGTMTDMSAVPDASCDAIFSSHNIEHLYAHEVGTALREFRRVLRPDGFVVLTCPDLESVCELVLKRGLVETLYVSPAGPVAPIDILYGHRATIAAGKTYMAHRCGFTEKALVASFANAGFSTATMRRPKVLDLWLVGTPIGPSERQLRELAARHFPPLELVNAP